MTCQCNHGTTDVHYEYNYKRGISIQVGFTYSFSMSISDEVKEGAVIAEATETISASWGVEISAASTWSEERGETISYDIGPNKCMEITIVYGYYGTPSMNPYRIGSSMWNIYEVGTCDHGQL